MLFFLHPEARAEIDAIDYYWAVLRKRPDIAEDFADLLTACRAEMVDPVVSSRGYRTIFVNGVPTSIKRSSFFYFRGNTYVLYFVIDPNAIRFLALANTSQKPDYWIERIFDELP